MTPTGSNAVFHVTHIERAVAFYTTHLGFGVDFRYGDPEFYVGLSLGNVCLHLSSAYPYKNNTGHGHLYITFDEVDSLYRRLQAAGAKFYSPIANQPYGMRDFAVMDPDTNQIGIGAPLKQG